MLFVLGFSNYKFNRGLKRRYAFKPVIIVLVTINLTGAQTPKSMPPGGKNAVPAGRHW